MNLSDLWKKGTGKPAAGDLVVGGIGVDTTSGLVYSKKADNSVFSMGNGIKSITHTGGTVLGEDTTITIKFDDTTKSDIVYTAKAGTQGATGSQGSTGAAGATFSSSAGVLTITPS